MNKTCMVLGLAGLMAAPKLFAAMSVTLMDDTPGMNSTYSYSQGDGGEFRAVGNSGLDSVVNWGAYSSTTKGTVTAANDGSSWGYGQGLALPGSEYFQTFCTELLEEYTPGGLYPISSIGNAALNNNTGHPVPITLGVAYLYSHFAAGTLGGYDYSYTDGGGRSASAGNLQNAIWSLLGEQSMADLTGAALTDLQNSGIAQADWTVAANGAYGVEDMTLDNPGQAQDQLIMAVPETTTMLAGALLLLPLGASTLKILRKKRSV
jgi:hypothetical protein